jgi:hypothetical protein
MKYDLEDNPYGKWLVSIVIISLLYQYFHIDTNEIFINQEKMFKERMLYRVKLQLNH